MEVRPSAIEGDGLFLRGSVSEGARLGRFWGRVAFSSDSYDVAEDWGLAQADTRMVLLAHEGVWCVVDVRGCAFEMMNCSRSEEGANVHVSETGWVEAREDMFDGQELCWYYGSLYGLA